MKYVRTLFASGLFLASLAAVAEPANSTAAKSRETVLDGVEHIEPALIRDIPDVPRLCDALDATKGLIDIGGCRLYCEREGSATPIVLLHGGPGATHHYFHPYFSRAAQWAQVIYYDQRGCGQSDYKPGEGYSVKQAADDLDALRKALGIERWIVLGHSYGGTLAQCYAVKYPERVLGLVLVGSAGYGLPVTLPASREYEFMTQAERQRIAEVHADASLSAEQMLFNSHLNGDWKRQNFYRPTLEQLAYLARYEWVHDPHFRGPMSRSLDALDFDRVFDTCPLPILLIDGKWDLTWGDGKPALMQDCFPASTLVVFGRAGHNPFADVPSEFFSELKAFVSDLPQVTEAERVQWKERLAKVESTKAASPETLLRGAGWGKQSSLRLADRYSDAWLEQVHDPRLLLRLGFALYDAAKYEEALRTFRAMADRADPFYAAVAMVWQGQMLDLLGRREEAVDVYRRVADLNVTDSIRHDQYGLAYSPTAYAAERMKTPFTRVENQDAD